MNKIFLVGNLCDDPEMGETASGVAYGRFSVAVNRDYTAEDGKRETDFFNVTVWRGRAESCGKFLKKGNKVAIVGSLQNRSYEDKDGFKRYVTDVVALEVEFLTPKGNGEPRELPGADRYDKPADSPIEPPAEKPQLEQIDENQLPF